MKSTGYAVAFLVIISLLFWIRLRIEPYYVRGERVRVFAVSPESRLDFWRLRISYASAEYERKFFYVQNSSDTQELVLPVDGGSAGDIIVARNIHDAEWVLFKDNLGEFLINLNHFRAYSVWRFASNNLTPEVTNYNYEEWGRYPRERELLSDFCHDSWVYIGTLGGQTGDLAFVTKQFVKLPAHISMPQVQR